MKSGPRRQPRYATAAMSLLAVRGETARRTVQDPSKPDTGRRDDRRAAGEVHCKHFLQPFAHKRNDGASP